MYTYAFLKTSTIPLTLPSGIENPVQTIGIAQVSAIVEPEISESKLNALQDQNEALIQAVLAHDRVLRELFLQTTILPLRFGTCFASRQGLLTHLDAYQQKYLEAIARFEGKAEYTLKLVPIKIADTSISAELKGKDYFLARKQQYQAQLEWQELQRKERETIIQQFATACSQYRLSSNSGDSEKIYLLVDRQNKDQLLEYFRNRQSQYFYWQLTLGEALPPYHFLEI